jgi:hypothetical protein
MIHLELKVMATSTKRGYMRKIARALSVFVAAVTLLAVSGAQAQKSSNGLGVSPRKDYTVQPGKTINDTLYISNLSLRQDLLVSIRLLDFGAQDESGAPALQLNDDAPQTPWSLKPFVKVASDVRVEAGKSVNVPISVTIPAGQGAGSYYSAIEYTAQNPETEEKVNISASTVSLVFVNVPGNTKEQLSLKQFGAYTSDDQGLNGKFVAASFGAAPKELAYRLENSGNVAERPSGSMVVRNIFGQTVREIEDANPKKQLVLIGQTRRVQVCMKSSVLESKAPSGQDAKQTVCEDPGLLPGRYTAEMALYYGLNGSATQEVTAKTSFWYLPWWSLVGLGIIILLIAGLVWLIRRAFTGGGRRRYRH